MAGQGNKMNASEELTYVVNLYVQDESIMYRCTADLTQYSSTILLPDCPAISVPSESGPFFDPDNFLLDPDTEFLSQIQKFVANCVFCLYIKNSPFLSVL
jgi:hypothetical protein